MYETLEPTYVDKILHKTFLEVDETGTEAAAATAVVMLRKSAFETGPSAEFIADRPFLYFIVDDVTNVILFMGKQNFIKR